MAFKIISYKPEQGRYTRGTAFGLLVALAYYGAVTLYHFLSWNWASSSLGYTIPVVQVPVSPGFLIASAVFLGAAVCLRYAINHVKLAELLIDTEGELRRVTWPSWPETWNSSLVVIATVVAMLLLLAGADLVLARFFEGFVF
ncbi:MAG: preprotein translocase subunit SecE [Planctomycetes bacterium]|nr:preprotein translocase subunit SecE [Planctomycetota bacterium]